MIATLTVLAQLTSYVFVPNSEDGIVPNNPIDTVSVIDSQSNTVVATIAVGDLPMDVAVTPDGRLAYVTNNRSNTVSVIDVASLTVIDTIAVGSSLRDLVVSPDGRTVYVSDSAGDVSTIDVRTQTASGPCLSLGTPLRGITLSADGRVGYVVGNGTHTLTVFDARKCKVAATIPVDRFPRDVALMPGGATAYVASTAMDTVTPIDLASYGVGTPIPVGDAPQTLAITPDGRWIFSVNRAGDTISVIDSSSRAVVRTRTVGFEPIGIALTPDGRTAYVTNGTSDSVTIVDIPVGQLPVISSLAPIPVGRRPFHPGVTPRLIVPAATPLTIANDFDLTIAAFGPFVPFHGGTLKLTANWSSARHLSILSHATIDTNGFDADLTGDVRSDGVLKKEGLGTLTLRGHASHATTKIRRGRLTIDGLHDGRVELGALTTLAGSGTIGEIIANTGAINPGRTLSPATLHAGNVTMHAGSTLQIEINSATAYDRLDVTGTADITGATLNVQPIWVTPTSGTTYTIVTNATGTFAGLPEGTLFTSGLGTFRITYVGGDGNDIVITAM